MLEEKFFSKEYETRKLTENRDDWFTVEQIDSDTYAISEYKHWEETHCYLLCGTKKAVLIDTGLGVANIRNMVDKITNLPVEVITTHVHWDHIGGHKYFDYIAVHEKEYQWLAKSFPIPLEVVKRNLMREKCEFPASFRTEQYEIYQGEPNQIIKDGDIIDLGERKMMVIHTPGHSPGHCCFYEKDRKYLYSGDLIYSGCLDAFYPTTNPQLFWNSVKRVNMLEISKILPGHHELEINVEIIGKIEKAFSVLKRDGKLVQGSGLFEFGDFQIHI